MGRILVATRAAPLLLPGVPYDSRVLPRSIAPTSSTVAPVARVCAGGQAPEACTPCVVGVQRWWTRYRLLGSSASAFASSCVRAVFSPHNPVKRQLQTLKVRVFFRLLWWDTTTPRETVSVTTRVSFTRTAARTRSMPAVETQTSQEQSQENQQEWRPVA